MFELGAGDGCCAGHQAANYPYRSSSVVSIGDIYDDISTYHVQTSNLFKRFGAQLTQAEENELATAFQNVQRAEGTDGVYAAVVAAHNTAGDILKRALGQTPTAAQYGELQAHMQRLMAAVHGKSALGAIGDKLGSVLPVVGGILGGVAGGLLATVTFGAGAAAIPALIAGGAALGGAVGGAAGTAAGSAVASKEADPAATAPAPSGQQDNIRAAQYVGATNTVKLTLQNGSTTEKPLSQVPVETLLQFGLPVPGKGPLGGYWGPQLLFAKNVQYDPNTDVMTFTLVTGELGHVKRSQLTPSYLEAFHLPGAPPSPLVIQTKPSARQLATGAGATSLTGTTVARPIQNLPSISTGAMRALVALPESNVPVGMPASKGSALKIALAAGAVGFVAWRVLR